VNDGNNLSKEGMSSKCTHVCLRFPCLNAASRDMSRLLSVSYGSYSMVTYGKWTYISLRRPHIVTTCTLKQRETSTLWSETADMHKHHSTPSVNSSVPAVDSPDSVRGSASGSQRGTANSQEIAKPVCMISSQAHPS